MKFNLKIEDLELKSCNKYLLDEGEHTTACIIKCKDAKSSSIVLANWRIESEGEGYNLIFVGDRPFQVDKNIFMKLADIGQELLDEHFILEQERNN